MAPVTLLSDFGPQDASVAIAKGVLLQYVPEAPLVDLSHLVEPFNIQQAAYLLLSAYQNFPKGSCHVMLIDIFSEAHPRLLLCEHEGQYLLAPDNGVLSLAFGHRLNEVWQCFELSEQESFADWLGAVGSTIKSLASVRPEQLNLSRCDLKVAPQHWKPIVSADTVECHVIHIDRYENVVINLSRKQFDEVGKGRPFRIHFMRDEELTQISTHFSSVKEGEKLCRFNATGFLEICINRGKAASLFGFKLHREKHFIYNTIKIYFG